jgi:hypothetical protein
MKRASLPSQRHRYQIPLLTANCVNAAFAIRGFDDAINMKIHVFLFMVKKERVNRVCPADVTTISRLQAPTYAKA